LLKVSDQSIRRWVKAGELKAYKPKKEYRIAESDLQEFLEGRTVPLVQAPLPEQEPTEERRASEELPLRTLLENLIARGEQLEEELKSAVDYLPVGAVYEFGTDSFALKRLLCSGPDSAQIREAWETVDALGMRVERLLEQEEGHPLTEEQRKVLDKFKRRRAEAQADVDLGEEAKHGNDSAAAR
jgi:excisionase family DNA binding protein